MLDLYDPSLARRSPVPTGARSRNRATVSPRGDAGTGASFRRCVRGESAANQHRRSGGEALGHPRRVVVGDADAAMRTRAAEGIAEAGAGAAVDGDTTRPAAVALEH